ncbi:polyprotein [Phytophthora megakarya]|uniref:Polyprotein n=1 Tax=Phytophthora megakarya TaxID=4795 RepID=A0A225W978_9STRA|nr:polyprotein [Phytophthora megakarya]
MQSKAYRSRIADWVSSPYHDMHQTRYRISRILEEPELQRWRAAIRVLRYMKMTRKHAIVYKKQTNGLKVEVATDADWGSNIDDRRSVSGIIVMINAPVVSKSKFQRTVALSSAEAEYMAFCLCVQEVLWMCSMLKNMGIGLKEATRIWEDNQGAIALAKDAGYNSRTKHVDVKQHFTPDNVKRETIKVDCIDSKRQVADLLTKALGTKTLKYLSNACDIKMKITAQ